MFSFSITKQLLVFLQSVGYGFIAGLTYNLLRLLLSLALPRRINNVVADTVFCVLFSLSAFCFVLAYNLGKLRLYLIMGIVFGVVLFFLTCGDIFRRIFVCTEKAAFCIRKAAAESVKKIKLFLKQN